jgi:SAM-dependent methyltransferase
MNTPASTWGVGEYGLMAARLESAATAAVNLARVARGEQVLDVACGTGNAALLARALGAHVTGLDLEPALLAQARARADAAELEVAWVQGDAADLPFPDGMFSVVISVFGVMYVPEQERAARELARVCAPAARVVLAAWVPGSFMPAMGGVLAPYLPPPPSGSAPPSAWGDETAQGRLLTNAGIAIERTSSRTLTIEFTGRDAAVDFLLRTAGNVLAEREALLRGGRWEKLRSDIAALVDQRDDAVGSAVSLRLEFLLTLASPHEHLGRLPLDGAVTGR